MTAIVLGAAAGGGFPQWNCRCDTCTLAWEGDARVCPRTQASLAVSGDGESWLLINASPDLRAQIAATPALHPRAAPRGSPIAAIVLTGAEIDQIAGLLSLREGTPFALYATAQTHATLAANPIFAALAPGVVTRTAIAPGRAILPLARVTVEAFDVPGKVPLYLEGAVDARAGSANIGLAISAGGRMLLYVPGAAALTPSIVERMARADVVMFDGTLFRDDEMIVTGTGGKSGRRMGHMPVGGPDGSLAALAGFAARRLYVHINNTNPMLVAGSPERRQVEAAGVEIASDGMRIEL
ncbi:MAG: pyrroloquinoline quinone biosynthesis protein PqqB [Proteobacteria bacterium]|nr:pyrroloquinoline quinone biosynthesis protein PqqB [Pseudomonadota bacterium]